MNDEKMMDKQDEAEAVREMMDSPGWHVVVRKLREGVEYFSSRMDTCAPEDLKYLQGCKQANKDFLGIPALILSDAKSAVKKIGKLGERNGQHATNRCARNRKISRSRA